MTSPLGPLVSACLNAMGADNEFSGFFNEEQKKVILRGVFDNYYRCLGDREFTFDTNRMWTSHLALIDQLFPESKLICCVRNPAWVLDSIEHLVRNNALDASRLFGNQAERATVYARAEALLNPSRLVGFAWSSLKEAYYGAHSGKLLFVDYDLLASRPREVLPLIYQFIGTNPFDHDFDHVSYESDQFDNDLLLKGLHRVGGKVELQERRTILPPDLFERCQNLAFWHDPRGTGAHRIVVNKERDDTKPDQISDEHPHDERASRRVA